MKILTTRSQLRHTLESGRRIIFEPQPPSVPPSGPNIFSISPPYGFTSGGTTVTITGSGFTGATNVSFGSTAADSFVVNSDTQITAVSPSGTGLVDVTVTTPQGTSPIVPADEFTYGVAWPEESIDWAVAVNATRIWGVQSYQIGYNTWPSPLRIMTDYIDLSAADIAGTDWSNVGPPGQILQDANYIYYLSNQCAVITRVPVNGKIADRQTLVIPNGMWPNEVAGSGTGIGTGAGGIWGAVINGTKMYIPWAGKWAGNNSQMKLVVVDLAAWSPTGYAVYDYSTDLALLPGAWGACVTDNGTIIIQCQIAGGSPAGRIYYANTTSPGTWNFINLTYSPGFSCSSGNYVYVLETIETGGTSGRKTHLIIVNCTASPPTVAYVDMSADDTNFQWISQASQNKTVFPWVSGTHLFLNANYTDNLSGANAHATEHPYIAKRNLITGSSAGGALFRNILPWTWEAFVDTNAYFNNTHFIEMYTLSSNGILVTIDEALTTATLWPNPLFPIPPTNDLLANASAISVGQTLTGQNCYFATWEANEDYGPHGAYPTGWDSSDQALYAPEHGVWYKYHATATATRTITLIGNSASRMSLSVWTGAAHPLTNVAVAGGSPPGLNLGSPAAVTFNAVSGTDYSIRADFMPFNWWEPEIDTTHIFSIALT